MTAAVIAFPRRYAPRPREELKLSESQLAAYDSYITCQGDEVTDPFTWERAIRMLIMIRPDHTNLLRPTMVHPAMCHQALDRFAIEVAQTAFGLPVELLRMVALLPVGRSKSPGYGHLKLPHSIIAVSAAEQR